MASHPRFGSLAQAVRAGIQLVPDPAPHRRYFGVSSETGRLGCDALAAAWFAEYYDGERSPDEDWGLHRFLSARLAEAYPVLSEDLGLDCPLGPNANCSVPDKPGRTLEAKVIHLQDEHRVSREKVADWLEAQGF
jgi:hypothetical protein